MFLMENLSYKNACPVFKTSRTLFDEAPQFLDGSGVSRESIETHSVQPVGLDVFHELDQELGYQNLLTLTVLGQVGSKYWICGGGRGGRGGREGGEEMIQTNRN